MTKAFLFIPVFVGLFSGAAEATLISEDDSPEQSAEKARTVDPEELKKDVSKYQTKDPEYYEALVVDFQERGLLGKGRFDEFENAARQLALDDVEIQGYQRFSLTLYGRGYEEESALIYEVFVKPKKKYTPEQALDKARKLAGNYDKAREKLVNGVSAGGVQTGETSPLPPSAGQEQQKPDLSIAPSATLAAPTPAKPVFIATEAVMLKNGHILRGKIAEEDERGLWLEAGQGAKIYLSRKEIKEVRKNPA